MLKIEECRKYLLQKHLDDHKIEELRDNLSTIIKEIIKNQIQYYYEKKHKEAR